MSFIKHKRFPRVSTEFRSDEILFSIQTYQHKGIPRKVYKIIIYSSAWRKHFKSKKFVELFFDAQRQLVGFLPLDEPSEDAYALNGKTAKSFSCKRFFLDNDIRVGESGHMRCKLRQEEDYLVASVDPKYVLGFDCHGTHLKNRRAEEIAGRLNTDTGFTGKNVVAALKAVPSEQEVAEDSKEPKRRGRPAKYA